MECFKDPNKRGVCVREIQRSLKFSAKSLIESKIRDMGIADAFDIRTTEIRHRYGDGIIIFEGLQNHTADSIKSLENFSLCWIEEAHRISQRSLDILTPTIRAEGSEIWATWNPDQPDDPIEKYSRMMVDGGDGVVVHVNYPDNPWLPKTLRDEAERRRRVDPDGFEHIWMGGFDTKSDAQVLKGKWRVDEFEPLPTWDGPYFGADWGYAADPTVLVKVWIADGRLWIEHEAAGVAVGMDDLPALFERVPGSRDHKIRGDSARPETIAYMARTHGFNIDAAPKWGGSVEDGVEFLRKFDEIVIHERCRLAVEEARLWKYKEDRLTGDVLPKLVDGNDHIWDAVRYALAPLIKPERRARFA